MTEVPVIETFTGPLPEVTRGGGLTAGPYSEAMRALKAPTGKGANQKFQAFFVAAKANPELTNPEEIEKDIREKARKLSNSFAGIARRIQKGDASYKFAFRTVRQIDGDETSPLGVRVYRIEA